MSLGLTVDFNASLAQFEDQINRVVDRLGELGTHAESIGMNVGKVFATLGAGLAIHELFDIAKGSADSAAELLKLGNATGISVEHMAGLKVATQQFGFDLDNTAELIDQLSQNISANREQYAALGVTARDPLEAFKQFGDVLVNIKDPQERAAVGAKVMGDEWAKVSPLLLKGSDGITAIIDEGSKASGVTTQMALDANELGDKTAVMEAKFQSLVSGGITPLIPQVNNLLDYFTKYTEKADVAGTSTSTVTKFLTGASYVVATASTGFEIAGAALGLMGAKLDAIAHFDFKKLKIIDEAFTADVKNAENRLADFYLAMDKGQKKVVEGAEVTKKSVADAATGTEHSSIRVANANDQAVRSFLGVGQTAAEYGNKLNSLLDRLFPAQAAQRKLKDDTDLLTKALQDGKINLDEYQKGLDALKKSSDGTAQSFTKQTEAVAKFNDEAAKSAVKSGSSSSQSNQSDNFFGETAANGKAISNSSVVETNAFGIIVSRNGVKVDGTRSTGFLPGFGRYATGGSFKVGGSGGTDSQLVSFMASPDERVTIETPAQQRQSSGGNHVFNITMYGVQNVADFVKKLEEYARTTPINITVGDRNRVSG